MLKFSWSSRVIFPLDWSLESWVMKQQCGACVNPEPPLYLMKRNANIGNKYKFQWNFSQGLNLLIQGYSTVICKMPAILSGFNVFSYATTNTYAFISPNNDPVRRYFLIYYHLTIMHQWTYRTLTKCDLKKHYITYSGTLVNVERRAQFEFTADTPYLRAWESSWTLYSKTCL